MAQIIDTLHLCIALVPLAGYFLLIGLLNLIARPVVLSGGKDALALGFAVSGFVIAGPMELFQPTPTAFRLGAFVWLLLLAFYVLSLTLVILLIRPRIVIYNVGPEQIRPVLTGIIATLDSEARWAGDCLYLPTIGVQLHVESVSLLRNVQLIANGPAQSLEGWSRLESALKTTLRPVSGQRNLYGASLVLCGLLILVGLTAYAINDYETVVQSLNEMLHVGEQ
jgi:hypothetical protein